MSRTGPAAFAAELESEEELREEHRLNLTSGALRLPTVESVPLHTSILIALKGPFGASANVNATVVAHLADGLALTVDSDPDDLLRRLLARGENTWDRMRSLSQMEKILLAVKADRTERALLLQDTDPRVLLALLRNPRLTVEEVARVARSPHLTFQIAEVIVQTTQWMSSLDVRLGLVHNPKTPPAFSLRILPTLPDQEVRAIARAGTSMQLKQAALRKLQGK
ncbi:MAG TPA: hypothetical protein VM733_13395 [Thermoanaerobaculia bacterium]|nr:hypothetical protein [Thermoanaerobaculia bacterium]